MQDTLVQIMNQIFEIAQKIDQADMNKQFERNFNRVHHLFEAEGLSMLNPLGERYSENRTDYEANIVGNISAGLRITKVIKPIIYKSENGQKQLVQKGIVIAE